MGLWIGLSLQWLIKLVVECYSWYRALQVSMPSLQKMGAISYSTRLSWLPSVPAPYACRPFRSEGLRELGNK